MNNCEQFRGHYPAFDPVQWLWAQVADCLAKVARQVTAAAAEAAKREGMLAAVAELGAAREEAAWLKAYEQDDDRYKACAPKAVAACYRQAPIW